MQAVKGQGGRCLINPRDLFQYFLFLTGQSKHNTGLGSTTSAPRGGDIKTQNERCG